MKLDEKLLFIPLMSICDFFFQQSALFLWLLYYNFWIELTYEDRDQCFLFLFCVIRHLGSNQAWLFGTYKDDYYTWITHFDIISGDEFVFVRDGSVFVYNAQSNNISELISSYVYVSISHFLFFLKLDGTLSQRCI